jgi:hypothetical protein
MSTTCPPLRISSRGLLGCTRLLLTIVSFAALASCGGGGGGGGAPPPLTLSTPATTLGAGTTETVLAAGGKGPYVYSIVSGDGSIDSSTGVFTAPATAGTTVVEVTDALGATAKSSLQILVVAFVHVTAIVDAATTTSQAAAGGAPPYTYSVLTGGGTINATGQFTAPAGPAMVTLKVTDSKGATAEEAITVNAALVAAQATVTVGGGTTLLIGATGGQGPFAYAVTAGGGSVDGSGHFIAPSTAGTSVVTVTDALGVSITVTITINLPLSISPASATLTASSGQTTAFVARNGVPPYSYSLASGAGSVDAQGIYTVGAVSGVNSVRVTDSQGTAVSAQVRALRIRVNGAVFATASDGTNLFVGGRFSAVNPYPAPRLAIVDQVSGNMATGCDLGNGFLGGYVTSVVTMGNWIYVGGNFNQYRGLSVGKVAKIDATTCVLDTVFTAGGGFGQDLGETVNALAISGTSLYVLGNLDSYRGASIFGLVKLDTTSGVADPAFVVASFPNAGVSSMVVAGAALYVGGYFTQFGGVTVPYVAKLNAASGAIDTAFAAAAGADGPVNTLAIAANALYVGGSFTHFAGVGTALAKVNATSGALDAAFTQGVANVSQVASLLPVGNSIYVGRQFPGGTPTLQKLDTTTGTTDVTFGAGAGFDFGVNALLLANSSLYVGGNFTSYRGTAAHNLAKLDPASGVLDTTFTQPTGGDGNVASLAAIGTQIVAGGSLSAYRGVAANNIAKFVLATDAVDTAFNAAAGTNSNVIAMAVKANALYIGGVFTACGTVASFGVAKVDTDTGTPDAVFAGGGGAGFGVDALLIHGNSLYLGGGGPNHLAKLDLLSGQTDAAFSVNGSPDGIVNALADTPTAIYLGGQFQNYGASPARNLAKVDPVTGALDQAFTQATGAGGGTEFIYSLLTAGTSVYAGGFVNTYRGSTVQGLLKLDAVTGALDATFTQATGFLNGVLSLASSGSSILVAGSFRTYRGIQSFNLVKVNASSGNLDPAFTSSMPCDSCDVNFDTMSLVGSHLYVGGDYTTLYRGAPAFGVFPVDVSTGAPTDP